MSNQQSPKVTERPTRTASHTRPQRTSCVGVVIFLFFFYVAVSAAVAQPSGLRITSSSGYTTQLSQYGITWYFDEPVEYGQFLNGDYWVADPDGVVITEITPPFDGRNGTMINPVPGPQGYDTEASASFDSELAILAPVHVRPESSVVSTIARYETTPSDPRIQAAAVLTVLSRVPPDDAFRPSLHGSDKTIYRWSDVESNLSILPNLSPVVGTPTDTSYYLRWSERPWILHGPDWKGRSLHPSENIPGTSGYHREIGRFLSGLSSLVLMDVDRKLELTRNLVQIGLDYYGMMVNGYGTSATWQWPTVFAGVMLGESSIAGVFVDGRSYSPGRFHEHLYRITTEQNSTVMSSLVPDGLTWTGETAAWRQATTNSDCYEQEHLHPSEWAQVSAAQGCSQPLSSREAYREINSPAIVGMALAASAMGARDYFSRPDLFFEYAQRWMSETDANADVFGDPKQDYLVGAYGSSTIGFVDSFWRAYGAQYGFD